MWWPPAPGWKGVAVADLTSVLVQIAVGAVPLGVAWFAFRSATDANRRTQETAAASAERQAELDRTKVDAEAYGRAKAIYEDALAQLEKQLDRMQRQFDSLNEQLAKEQDTSNALRAQLTSLRTQLHTLERTVASYRRSLITAGLTPPEHPVAVEEGEDLS